MSKTSENLLKAIAGESMARNKYTYFAEIAEKEGYLWISKVFLETADNERAHAQEELEKLTEKAEMTNTYDIDPIGTTLENLKHAAAGEKFEHGEMYPNFEKDAREEGETEIADLFKEISEVEEKHEERYNILTDLVEKGKVFEAEEEVDPSRLGSPRLGEAGGRAEAEWKCLNCGYIHKGKSAPKECPLCKKPQSWYMRLGLVR